MSAPLLPRQSASPFWSILPGDCRESLATLDAGSVQACVTSPPYFGLRDYGHKGQIGLEKTPESYAVDLVKVFREVRRVLADDGTVWLNLGDSYAGGKAGCTDLDRPNGQGVRQQSTAKPDLYVRRDNDVPPGCKPKDLLGIPWLIAFALREDGWYLRSEIIWSKPSPMPESVRDRPTKAHETIFLLSKSLRYFYDADAIAEPVAERTAERLATVRTTGPLVKVDESRKDAKPDMAVGNAESRNKRSVWTVASHAFPGAHFATFPPKLIEPCILAGCPEGGTVLDPFAGAGTTGMVALRHNRSFVGCELNPEYVAMARDRIIADSPLLNTHAEAA